MLLLQSVRVLNKRQLFVSFADVSFDWLWKIHNRCFSHSNITRLNAYIKSAQPMNRHRTRTTLYWLMVCLMVEQLLWKFFTGIYFMCIYLNIVVNLSVYWSFFESFYRQDGNFVIFLSVSAKSSFLFCCCVNLYICEVDNSSLFDF